MYISTNSTPVTHVENLPLFTFSTIHLKFNIGKHYTGTKQQASQLMMLTIFKFTVMDERQNLYFVRGDNPMCIYHYPALGLYIYASTEAILQTALKHLPFKLSKPSPLILIAVRSCGSTDWVSKPLRRSLSRTCDGIICGITPLCRQKTPAHTLNKRGNRT